MSREGGVAGVSGPFRVSCFNTRSVGTTNAGKLHSGNPNLSMIFSIRTRFVATVSLVTAWMLGASFAGTLVVSTPRDFFTPELYVVAPPSFAIAGKGLRHPLAPSYSSRFFWLFEEEPVRTCHCTLLSGPAGLTVSDAGVIDWNPDNAAIDQTSTVEVGITVIQEGVEVFSTTRTFDVTALAGIPQLSERPPQIGYEQDPIGWSGVTFSGFQPNGPDHKLFRWSLINPPPGVYIDDEGGLHWPDDRGFARAEPYIFKVRIDYETASGPVSDEVEYSRYVLPQPATNDYREMWTHAYSQRGGMLGFSTDATDGWVAAGEPFPEFSNSTGNLNTGRVRLWKKDEEGGIYSETLAIQPEFGLFSQAFGASVSLSPANATRPTRLAVGAPDAQRVVPGIGTRVGVGCVYVYSCDAGGVWKNEGRLDPPVIKQSLQFGGWVSIEGDTLIASMDGMDTEGTNTGALAIYQYNGNQWKFSEMLQAPAPAWGDYFSYPANLSDGWIAAAANEDDDEGNNSGAVHLFEKVGGHFVHRQQIHAPVPEADALFGERLLMKGPWLFVSSFREQGNTGAVHVYKRTDGIWSFRQTLKSPYAEAGSAFGVALSVTDGVLAVSAPGHLFGSSEIDGSLYPWSGITLFRLEGDSWKWQRQVTQNPDGSPGPNTWGFSVTQLSAQLTVASMPDYQAQVNGVYLPYSGRLFLHRWPDLLPDPFIAALAGYPATSGQATGANDDSNCDGTPNLLEWMMGYDAGRPPDPWTAMVPESKRTFIKKDAGSVDLRLMVPRLKRGLRYRPVVESSYDLVEWKVVQGARWESVETVYFKRDDSNYSTYFHPVVIPADGSESGGNRFFRLKVGDN